MCFCDSRCPLLARLIHSVNSSLVRGDARSSAFPFISLDDSVGIILHSFPPKRENCPKPSEASSRTQSQTVLVDLARAARLIYRTAVSIFHAAGRFANGGLRRCIRALLTSIYRVGNCGKSESAQNSEFCQHDSPILYKKLKSQWCVPEVKHTASQQSRSYRFVGLLISSKHRRSTARNNPRRELELHVFETQSVAHEG